MTPFLTLFTAPKAFTDPHTSLIQHNALRSWQALGESVSVVVVGDEEGIADAAKAYGFTHRPDVRLNPLGTPLISSIFDLGRQQNDSPFLAYVNADIILFPEILEVIRTVANQAEQFLLIGRRWDLEVTEPIAFEGDWVSSLKSTMRSDGKLHKRTGSDYFIFPRACFQQIPDFSVGRAGWDNWMIYQARRQGWLAVDCSNELTIIHQDHDYRHLPDGKPHYRLPETGENIRLAGGRRTIFVLDDASHRLVRGKIESTPRDWKGRLREFQNRPMLKNNNFVLTQLLFTLFHPKLAWVEFWKNREMLKVMQSSRESASK
jgi:hypothetical protein